MIFNSIQYALFLPLVVGLHWMLPSKWRNPLLLIASYAFYASWNYRFLALLFASTTIDYFVGLLLRRQSKSRNRRLLLAASVAANLTILGTFKYLGFFVRSAGEFLAKLGFSGDTEALKVILPVGISFYTFKEISYVVDIYRGKTAPCRNFALFALFVAYFPQLVAGPIERVHQLMPALKKDRPPPTAERVQSGLSLILLGLFKKVVLADPLAPVVSAAFSGASHLGTRDLVIGLLAFTLEIYADFSAYTDIARGSSRLLGIELIENFSQPYLSASITEFWRRWHISLSSWLRDYVYVPLGGNQKGSRRTALNILITMLLGGLWHGAGLTFVAWGGLHGLFLIVERMRPGPSALRRVNVPGIARVARTFMLVSLAWILFRASSFRQAIDFYEGIFSMRPNDPFFSYGHLVLPNGLVILAIDLLRRRVGAKVLTWKPAYLGAAYALMSVAILVESGTPSVPFIYFQF